MGSSEGNLTDKEDQCVINTIFDLVVVAFTFCSGVWFPSTSAFKGLHSRFAVCLLDMTLGVLML